jgi:cytochrome c peroxidase
MRRSWPFSFAVLAVAGVVIAACSTQATTGSEAAPAPAAAAKDPWLRPAAVPFPPDNAPTATRIALGRTLFFDPRLSGSGMISCAWCHNPARSWSDGQPTAIGNDFKRLGRKTPTVLNTAYQPLQMWDGRKTSLEDQALGPIEAAGEMNMPLDKLVAVVSHVDGYKPLFEAAYPGEGVTTKTVAKAIASFERTVVSGESPFDRWREGDAHAIGEQAQRGFALFTGKAQCSLCHQGFNFTDNGFHNIGVRTLSGQDDEGRFAQRHVKVLKGAFKTPTLRDCDQTAPYMHNGMYATLEEVVDHYDRGGDVKTNLSPNIHPLGLTPQEKQDLVAFLHTLTSPPLDVVVPHLPPT